VINTVTLLSLTDDGCHKIFRSGVAKDVGATRLNQHARIMIIASERHVHRIIAA
jgi:hypothetical protein